MAGYNEILDHVLNHKGNVFFVDGPGGTGKTYLYRALQAKVRSMGLIDVATATSGIAASIMPDETNMAPFMPFRVILAIK